MHKLQRQESKSAAPLSFSRRSNDPWLTRHRDCHCRLFHALWHDHWCQLSLRARGFVARRRNRHLPIRRTMERSTGELAIMDCVQLGVLDERRSSVRPVSPDWSRSHLRPDFPVFVLVKRRGREFEANTAVRLRPFVPGYWSGLMGKCLFLRFSGTRLVRSPSICSLASFRAS